MYLYMNILQFRTIYVPVHEHIVCLELYIYVLIHVHIVCLELSMCQVSVHEQIVCLKLSMYPYMNILQFRTIYVPVHEHIAV